MKQTSILTIFLTSILIADVGVRVLAQVPAQKSTLTPIFHANNHSAYFSVFESRKTRDRSLELEVQKKGLDVAFSEWFQRTYPVVFASECAKQTGDLATEFKPTNYTLEFAKLVEKRTDLHYKASKFGYDVAFQEWLRTERPEAYHQQFGVKEATKK